MKRQEKQRKLVKYTPRLKSPALFNSIANCKVGPAAFFKKNITKGGPPWAEYRRSSNQGQCVLFGPGAARVGKSFGLRCSIPTGTNHLFVSNNMQKRAKKLGVALAAQGEVDAFLDAKKLLDPARRDHEV